MKLAKLFLTTTVVLFLMGCAPATPTDVLKAGPESTANFIAETLEKGEGSKLCDLSNQIASGSCEFFFDSKGLGSKPNPEVTVSPIVEDAVQYRFEGHGSQSGSYAIIFSAVPFKTESGQNWDYKIDIRLPELSYPFGAKYRGTEISPNESVKIMPGEFRSDLEVFKDKSGWFDYSFENDEDRFTFNSAKYSELMEAVRARCISATKSSTPDEAALKQVSSSSFKLKSITVSSECESDSSNSVESITMENIRIDYATTYQVKGYEDWGWLGKPPVNFDLTRKFYSIWTLVDGAWTEEKSEFLNAD